MGSKDLRHDIRIVNEMALGNVVVLSSVDVMQMVSVVRTCQDQLKNVCDVLENTEALIDRLKESSGRDFGD